MQKSTHEDNGTAARIAIEFFKQLRKPPWLLTAIIPDDKTTLTVVAHNAQDVADFVTEYNGKRNLYYWVNPVRQPIAKKAAKTDISAIEYVLSDLDPAERETPEEAKARYLKALESMISRIRRTTRSGRSTKRNSRSRWSLTRTTTSSSGR
jgi:hypothetical protein